MQGRGVKGGMHAAAAGAYGAQVTKSTTVWPLNTPLQPPQSCAAEFDYSFVVGRTMYETDLAPKDFVDRWV